MRLFAFAIRVAIPILLCSASFRVSIHAAAAPPRSYQDLPFTEFFRRTNGWVAGDGALSVPLRDGRVFWVFGDSHLDDYDAATGTLPCLFQVRNAGLLHPANHLEHTETRTLKGDRPKFRSLFKNQANDDSWFWPAAGIQLDHFVYIYLNELRKTATPGMWGFESTGQDFWGKMKFPEMTVIAYVPLPDFHGIDFGRGLVHEERSGYTFVFGNKRDGHESNIYVARFWSAGPEGVWHFWDGTEWNRDAASAAIIAWGASTSVHVCKVKSKYILTTSEFSVACDQGTKIFCATSDSPTGPFSTRKPVYEIDDTVKGHRPFFYLPVAHSEFINDRNELLLTYSINGYEPCFPACDKGRMPPDDYRPRAIRVPLKLIHPDL